MEDPVPVGLDVMVASSGVLTCALGLRGMLAFRDLPVLPQASEAPSGRRVSVRAVLPSRDSDEALTATIRRLLEQNLRPEIRLEVVVVDDRSQRPVSESVPQDLLGDPRLRTMRIDQLPGGWLGKPHACTVGARDFEGDFLLFIDDDTWTEPDFLQRLVEEAICSDADHLCLLPRLRDTTPSGRALVAAMAFGMLQRIRGLESDRPGPGFGVGACTLVRRTAYEAVGGHADRRMDVLEDIELANAIRSKKLRSRIRVGTDVVSVRWIQNWSSAFGLTEKNWFAAFDYRTTFAILGVAVGLVVGSSNLFGPFVAERPVARTLAGLGLLTSASLAAAHARRVGWSWWTGILAPIAQVLIPVTIAWSALRITRDGGVRWRSAFHPLAELRAARRAPRA